MLRKNPSYEEFVKYVGDALVNEPIDTGAPVCWTQWTPVDELLAMVGQLTEQEDVDHCMARIARMPNNGGYYG